MKEVIEEILQVEKEARGHIEEARRKAKEIVLQAEAEAKALKTKMREESSVESQKFLADLEEKAQKEKEETLAAAREAGDSLWEDKKEVLQQTVQTLVSRYLNQE